MSAASPCRQVCDLDETRSFCRTCRRTLPEIAGWGGMSEAGREDVLAALSMRDDADLRRLAEAERGERRARRKTRDE